VLSYLDILYFCCEKSVPWQAYGQVLDLYLQKERICTPKEKREQHQKAHVKKVLELKGGSQEMAAMVLPTLVDTLVYLYGHH